MDKFEYSLTTYLNGINLKQGNIQDDERAMKKYPKFVINKCMSDYIDCFMYSNEMNRYYELDNDLQYNFYHVEFYHLFCSYASYDHACFITC